MSRPAALDSVPDRVHASRKGFSVSGNRISTGAFFSGDSRVDFDGTMVGNRISGSCDAVRAGACTGDTGTFSLDR